MDVPWLCTRLPEGKHHHWETPRLWTPSDHPSWEQFGICLLYVGMNLSQLSRFLSLTCFPTYNKHITTFLRDILFSRNTHSWLKWATKVNDSSIDMKEDGLNLHRTIDVAKERAFNQANNAALWIVHVRCYFSTAAFVGGNSQPKKNWTRETRCEIGCSPWSKWG